ncbi:hypothetical protein [Alteromonas sp. 14N.309.X.WAT.G.H12]|uniref:hypothetical protein n=1 Tax=Alteromonas sp. 14N.309.X.WAT.G.H12 TaxID=3120824 RepID=UPI002FD75FA1
MSKYLKAHYENLMLQAQTAAESKFSATFVTSSKNVLLLREKSPRLTRQPFLTMKVNLHDMHFHDGRYDMSFDSAVEDFKGCVENSSFNPQFDTPAIKGGK